MGADVRRDDYVIDAEHAERYERRPRRGGVLVNFDQAKIVRAERGQERMWNYHGRPAR